MIRLIGYLWRKLIWSQTDRAAVWDMTVSQSSERLREIVAEKNVPEDTPRAFQQQIAQFELDKRRAYLGLKR
jgi:hypothetical protein